MGKNGRWGFVKSKTADWLLLCVAFVWGGGFPAVDLALQDGIGASQLITMRFSVAAIGMAFVFRKHLWKIKRIDVIAGAVAGVCLLIGFAFQTIGIQYTTVSKNAFITSSYVLLVPLISLIFLKKKIKWSQWGGIFLMIIGISVLSLEDNLTINLGDTLTLICAIGFSLQIIVTGVFIQRCNPYCFNTIQMVTVAIISFMWSIWTEPWQVVSLTGGLAVLYLGILSTLLAFLIQSVAQRYTSEAKVALILSTESLFGALLSVLILQEAVTSRLVIGGLIILFAILMIEFDFEKLTVIKFFRQKQLNESEKGLS